MSPLGIRFKILVSNLFDCLFFIEDLLIKVMPYFPFLIINSANKGIARCHYLIFVVKAHKSLVNAFIESEIYRCFAVISRLQYQYLGHDELIV